MWSENIDVIEDIFLSLAKINTKENQSTFKNLMCVSSLYNSIGTHVLNKNSHKYGCKCICDKMIKHKISDTVKSWKCINCDLRISWNSWKRSDYYSQKINKDVCKKCFKHHWVGTLFRKKDVLLNSE